MALSIRLSRGGSKKRPYYRVVVADARSPRDGKYLEKIGTYNPLLAKDSEQRVQLDADRARHWLSVGAQPTDRVARFLDAAGVKERAVRSNPNKGKPGEKATERADERAKKQEATDAALAAASAAPAVVEPVAPEAAATEATATEVTTPEATTPDAATPEATTPASTAPDSTGDDDAKATAGAPNTGQSAATPAEGEDDAPDAGSPAG